jgi:cytochrome P450
MTGAVERFDPVELQGGLLMQVENVHERLHEARSRNRVMVGSPFAETASQTLGSDGVTVLGYQECQRVLTHPDTFSSSIYSQVMGPVMGRTLLELEGADHRASRALVSPSFRAALLDRWRTDLVELVVHELIDVIAPRGPGTGDCTDHGFTASGLPALPTAFDRIAECRLQLGLRDCRIGGVEGVLLRDPGRAAKKSAG